MEGQTRGGTPSQWPPLGHPKVDQVVDSTPLSEAGAIIKQIREMSEAQEWVLFLYGPPSFDLVPVDERSLKQDNQGRLRCGQKKL